MLGTVLEDQHRADGQRHDDRGHDRDDDVLASESDDCHGPFGTPFYSLERILQAQIRHGRDSRRRPLPAFVD
jgi:hypothetical protein